MSAVDFTRRIDPAARRILSSPLLFGLMGDDWSEAVRGRSAAEEHLARLTENNPNSDPHAAVRAALLDTAGDPTPAVRTAAQEIATAGLREHEVALTQAALDAFTGDLNDVASTAGPHLLRQLDKSLQAVLEVAAALRPADIQTAEAAIATDRTDDYTQLTRLHREYLAIRHSAGLVSASLSPDGRRSQWHTLFGSVDAAWPEWLATTTGHANLGAQPHAGAQGVEPWPIDPDSLEHFVYVVEHRDTLQPRVAHPDQVTADWERDRRAVNARAHGEPRDLDLGNNANRVDTPEGAKRQRAMDRQIARARSMSATKNQTSREVPL